MIEAVSQDVAADLLDAGLYEKSLEALRDKADLKFMRMVEYQASILGQLGRCST